MSQNYWHIPTSDEEIIDIYLEEVGELLEQIDEHLKTWMVNPGDKKSLTEIRRAFHTMKGSGRMANVLDLSELAWKVENMLNQAISGVVPSSHSMVELVAAVRGQIPRVVEAFKEGRSLSESNQIVRLMNLAESLAKEKNPVHQSPSLPPGRTEERQSPGLYDINLKLEYCMQRADEALRRSEMALQQARTAVPLVPGRGAAGGFGHGSKSTEARFGWAALILSAFAGGIVGVCVYMAIVTLG